MAKRPGKKGGASAPNQAEEAAAPPTPPPAEASQEAPAPAPTEASQEAPKAPSGGGRGPASPIVTERPAAFQF